MPWYTIVLLVLLALNSILSIALIGKTRDPMTPGSAVFTLIANVLFGWAVIATYYAGA